MEFGENYKSMIKTIKYKITSLLLVVFSRRIKNKDLKIANTQVEDFCIKKTHTVSFSIRGYDIGD